MPSIALLDNFPLLHLWESLDKSTLSDLFVLLVVEKLSLAARLIGLLSDSLIL